MLHGVRWKAIVILILTVIAAWVLVPSSNKPALLSGARINLGPDLAGGAELRYRVLFKPGFTGDKPGLTRLAADVIRHRLEAKLLREPKVYSYGEDEIVLHLAGVDGPALDDCKRLVREIGKLELHACASADLQARFERDRVVPEGYREVEDLEHRSLLIREKPIVDGRHVVHAEPQPETGPDGIRWVTLFELDAEGAKLFDEAAEKLFGERPRGRIAIVVDDKVRSAPVVQSPAFHGRGRISGPRESPKKTLENEGTAGTLRPDSSDGCP